MGVVIALARLVRRARSSRGEPPLDVRPPIGAAELHALPAMQTDAFMRSTCDTYWGSADGRRVAAEEPRPGSSPSAASTSSIVSSNVFRAPPPNGPGIPGRNTRPHQSEKSLRSRRNSALARSDASSGSVHGSGNVCSRICMITRDSVMISPSSSTTGRRPEGTFLRNHAGFSPYEAHVDALRSFDTGCASPPTSSTASGNTDTTPRGRGLASPARPPPSRRRGEAWRRRAGGPRRRREGASSAASALPVAVARHAARSSHDTTCSGRVATALAAMTGRRSGRARGARPGLGTDRRDGNRTSEARRRRTDKHAAKPRSRIWIEREGGEDDLKFRAGR